MGYDTLILKSIVRNDLQAADTLLSRHASDLMNQPAFYYLNGYLFIKKNNVTNAWLWLWRGLQHFPDDPSLAYLMWRVSEALHPHDQAAQYKMKYKSWNGSGDIASRFPLDLRSSESVDGQQSIRVLQASIEIANQMHTLSTGLGWHGITSHTLNYYPFYLNYRSNYEWSLIGQRNTPVLNTSLRKLALELQLRYDLFHFHWGTSLTMDGSDLPILQSFGKKLVMQHWGTDVRLYSEAVKRNPYALVKNRNEDQIKRNLETVSKHIRHSVVSDMELLDYVKDYYEHVSVIPAMIDLSRYTPSGRERRNEKPLIVHAPTSSYIKGTSYILKAVEALKAQYDFDFIAVQGKSHEEAMRIYQKADLIIDQLHIGSYGLLAVEAMAMGKPVICWISDYMRGHYPPDLPIITANPDNIQTVIGHAIKNIDMLPDKGKQGRAYVEKHHDMLKNSERMLSLYNAL